MVDRSTLTPAFLALLVLAALAALVASGLTSLHGESGNFPEDPAARTGPIYEQPGAYRAALLSSPWIARIPMGSSTFGAQIQRQVRIDIDGTGPIPQRVVTLQTAPAVAMFRGVGRPRAEGLLHGIERELEQRGGLLHGISFTEGRAGYEAAAAAGVFEQGFVDGSTREERATVARELAAYGTERSKHTYAWYDPTSQWVVVGPEVSRRLLGFVRAPSTLTPAEGLFAAFVVRHELEHAVTPAWLREGARLRWLEEGSADALARWPGAAAGTARELGLPYPKRFEQTAYDTRRAGYPRFAATLRILLRAAGVDATKASQFGAASGLLQATRVDGVPARLATRIAERHRMNDRQRHLLALEIAGVDGSPARARALVRALP